VANRPTIKPCRRTQSPVTRDSNAATIRPHAVNKTKYGTNRPKMTAEIANCVDQVLNPFGVAVVIEATHHCMTTRGVHKPGVTMLTSRMLGVFKSQPATRQEFLASLNLHDHRI
jgi:hypothetical protein